MTTKKKNKKSPPAPMKVLEPEVLRHEEGADEPIETEEALEAEIEAEASSAIGGPDSTTQLPAVHNEWPLDLAEIDPEKAIAPGAVSISDPLRRYLEEVRRYPLLSPEQELELALRLRTTGDIQAAKALVSANLRLVVKIAFEYKSLYANVMDLIQEGNVGLMKAVSKYDPSKGARLGYYASWWIKSYILKYLLDNFRLIKIGTTQAQKKLFYHLMRERERLEAQGILPEPKLLADKLQVREKDVVEMEGRLSGRGAEMSLDAPFSSDSSDGSSSTHMDFLADQNESADERIARDELVQILKSKLPEFEKSLNERERRLLHERLLNDEPRTLQEVANEYGLTRERARQIEAKVVFKLKQFLGSYCLIK